MSFMNIDVSKEAVSLIPGNKAFELNILPIKIEEGMLHVGIADKGNQKLINELSFYTGYKILPLELRPEVILEKLKSLYGSSEVSDPGNESMTYNENQVTEYSNVEFVNQMISNAINSGASDIHFEVYEELFRVRYRIDGHLREIINLQKSRSLAIFSRLKIMANLDISEKRRPQDGRIRFQQNSRNIDIRVSTLPTSYGEKIVLRILDKSQLQLDVNKLGLEEKQLEILLKSLEIPYGMILVTGPTGSGKTTTLYAALRQIHSIEKNILTVEDPVEYNLDGINQSNVKPDIGYDFASALRTFLRQDPDVIMVGEIRDKETAEIAIRASLTGHLVLSTLHTNDSVSAITRLIDMGIEPFLVASSVKLIIAQRLVRSLCDCKIPSINRSLQQVLNTATIFEPKGCEKCGFTGYKGRQAIFELLRVSEDITDLISLGRTEREIRQKALEKGFIMLKDSGIEKIKAGITTYEEVLRETAL